MKILKILAICLLIFALPVQGFAAASQAFCHGRQATHMVLQEDHGAHKHEHEHEQASSHHHDGVHADNKATQLNHKCSHCAQCCAGYAMAFSQLPSFALPVAKSIWVGSLPVLHGSISLSGLERPPRSPLA